MAESNETSLLAGRINRRNMSWMIGAVLFATPFEAVAHDHAAVLVTWPIRAAALLALFVGVRTRRLDPLTAGRIFLAQGVLTTVGLALLLDSSPDRVALETVAYGTILSILTLLITPAGRRRQWSHSVVALMLALGAFRLLPDDAILMGQVAVILLVHGAAVSVLDVHANHAERAGEMAGIDSLTGLANRRAMLLRLEERTGSRERPTSAAALVLLDLDHFKTLNDTRGHAAGDEALVQVADTLAALVHPTDTVARWGGEEFLVHLDNTSRHSAHEQAERFRSAIEASGVTASLGIADARHHDTVAGWIARADAAMYQAKHGGRNRIVVDHSRVSVPVGPRRS